MKTVIAEAIKSGTLHRMLLDHGVEACKQLSDSKHERQIVEIAAEMLAEETAKMGITHSGFCLTSLPHREPKLERWVRNGHKVTLIVQTGFDRKGDPIGLPYGAKARLILLYLQTTALQSGSRIIELGRNMNQFLARMDVSSGGKQYAQVSEQAKRISSCALTFFYDKDITETITASMRHNGRFVKTDIAFSARNAGNVAQAELFTPVVELDEVFYEELTKHPVPLWEPAIRAISGKSMAMDIYVWLAYRLHSLPPGKPTLIRWASLFTQFGTGFATQRQWKPDFVRNLGLAFAAYPGAQIEQVPEGLLLYQSPSPIPSKSVQVRVLPGGKV